MEYKIIYTDELYHHGVKGMKWGVRKQHKYEAKAEKWAGKEDRAHTVLRKNYASARRIGYQTAAKRQEAVNNASSRKEKRQQKRGYEDSARLAGANAEFARLKAERSKSHIGRHFKNIEAYNAKTAAEHYKKTAEFSPSTRKRVLYSMKNSMHRPVKSVVLGRQSTEGKEVAKILATTVLMNVAASALQSYAQNKMFGD